MPNYIYLFYCDTCYLTVGRAPLCWFYLFIYLFIFLSFILLYNFYLS